MEKFKTILLACLTVLMLTAAGIYIGGAAAAFSMSPVSA